MISRAKNRKANSQEWTGASLAKSGALRSVCATVQPLGIEPGLDSIGRPLVLTPNTPAREKNGGNENEKIDRRERNQQIY